MLTLTAVTHWLRWRHCVGMLSQEVEQRLLLECGRCLYQRALVLTATAAMQPDPSRQAALLEVR